MSYRNEGFHTYNQLEFKTQNGIDFTKIPEEDLPILWLKTLQKGMHGLCFSMYEEGQQPGHFISEEQVERRIKIIKPYTKWVRSFSCLEGNEFIPKKAKKHDLKTMVGAWLSDDLDKNEEELQALIHLAQNGYVDIAAVGNEVLYRNDFSLDQLLQYMQRVKKEIPNIPIGYVDAYYEFSQHPELVEHSDVVLANCYPFWEGCPAEYALNHMQSMYKQAQDAANGKKVIITETGWPNQGKNIKGAFPSNTNAMQYFINAQHWSKNEALELFYFSSFDESWKVGAEGDVGAYWGLWDKKENLKF